MSYEHNFYLAGEQTGLRYKGGETKQRIYARLSKDRSIQRDKEVPWDTFIQLLFAIVVTFSNQPAKAVILALESYLQSYHIAWFTRHGYGKSAGTNESYTPFGMSAANLLIFKEVRSSAYILTKQDIIDLIEISRSAAEEFLNIHRIEGTVKTFHSPALLNDWYSKTHGGANITIQTDLVANKAGRPRKTKGF